MSSATRILLAALALLVSPDALARAEGPKSASVTPVESSAEPDHGEPSDEELAALRAEGAHDRIQLTEAESPRPVLDVASIEWMPVHGRSCHRYLGRRVCEGPRRVPRPAQEYADRARELRIQGAAQLHALVQPAPAEWIAAAGPVPRTLLWPIENGRYGRGFGKVRRSRRHTPHYGIDISAREGTPIRAVNPGLVIYSDNGVRGYGNLVAILHGDGAVTMYAHCRANYVVPGQLVARGETIAEVGDTGLARGAHLHFEWRPGGTPRNPFRLFTGAPASVQDRVDALTGLDSDPSDGGEAEESVAPVVEVSSRSSVNVPSRPRS